MATGSIIDSGIVPDSYGTQVFDAVRARVNIDDAPLLAPGVEGSTLTNTQPITESPVALTGGLLPGFVDDYYNRFHFSALSFNVGNVVGVVQRTLTMWNGYFVPKTLQILTSSGTAGMSASGAGVSGIDTVRATQQVQTVFSIGVDGDPILRASYTFRIDDPGV